MKGVFVRFSEQNRGKSAVGFLGTVAFLFCAPEGAFGFSSKNHLGNCRGSTPPDSGKHTVVENGKGMDITAYGTEYGHHCGEDQGHFAYYEMSGDFEISMQVTEIDNFGATYHGGKKAPAKITMMARWGLDEGARYIAMNVASNAPGTDYPDAAHFDHRKSEKAWLGTKPEGQFLYGYVNRSAGAIFNRATPDIWLRLKREGNKISGFMGKDGVSWTAPSNHASFTDAGMPAKMFVGIALSSAPEGQPTDKSIASVRNIKGFPAYVPSTLLVRKNKIQIQPLQKSAVMSIPRNLKGQLLPLNRDAMPALLKH